MFVSCSGSDATEQPKNEDNNPQETEWKLLFEENFDTDFSKWNVWEGGAFNNEIQLYQQEQLSISNGILTINAKREAKEGATNPFDPTPKNFEYVLSLIHI